jgi:hypothetical protein
LSVELVVAAAEQQELLVEEPAVVELEALEK